MKRTIAQIWALAVASVLGFALTQSHAFAQETTPPPAPAQAPAPAPAPVATDSDDNVVVLSPFVVDATEDRGSYQAQASLGGTGIRTNLKDIASATSVVTQQFLQDTAVHNSGDLLVYTPNTEVTGLNGNYSAQAGNPLYNENTIQTSNVTRVRGLDTADDTRDYFLTDIPWDSFNVGRVDLERGPNSILFGVGSPAGIVNNVTNGATFHTAYNVTDTVGSFGSLRNSIDLNQVLLPGQLAIRFAALNDDEKYEQKQAWNNDTRYYAALRFDPKLLNAGDSHTSVTANWEHGVVNSDNPRDLPPR